MNIIAQHFNGILVRRKCYHEMYKIINICYALNTACQNYEIMKSELGLEFSHEPNQLFKLKLLCVNKSWWTHDHYTHMCHCKI